MFYYWFNSVYFGRFKSISIELLYSWEIKLVFDGVCIKFSCISWLPNAAFGDSVCTRSSYFGNSLWFESKLIELILILSKCAPLLLVFKVLTRKQLRRHLIFEARKVK